MPTGGSTSVSDDDVTVAVGHARAAAPAFALGTRLGRYLVLEVIGKGGMGLVLRAYDPQLDRQVALKLLRERGAPRPQAEAQLMREAQAMARLGHPNVVPVFDVGVADASVGSLPYIAMEYVEGETLRAWVKSPRPRDEVLRAFIAAGHGLAAAHAAGIVHRDFKPDNVIVGVDGRVRVMDFGIAQTAEIDDASDEIVGTPPYMAPEQHDGAPADARGDQYAFCVALWETLLGERPFRGRGAELRASKRAGLPAADGKRLPPWLRRLLLRGTAVDPAQRFAAMDQLVDALQAGVSARRGPKIVATVAGLGACAALAYAFAGVQPCTAAADELRGVWDPARRSAVEAAMLATGAPFAPATWTRIAERLDRYGAAWIDAHRDACEATAVRGAQSTAVLDARMACLAERRHRMRALVDVLADADASVVERAVRAAGELPAIDACSDVAYVAARVEPPDDPETAARADEIAATVATADALRRAGRYDDALAAARTATAQARALGHAPTTARALEALGSVLGRLRDAEALAVGEEAYYLALAAGDDELAGQVAGRLVYHVGHNLGRPDDGLAWARHATAVLARVPNAPDDGSLDNNIGAVLVDKGELAQARASFDRAIAKRRVSGDDASAAFAVANLGAMAVLGGDPDAEALLQEALTELERVLGADHPDVAGVLNNLAVLAIHRGEHDRALAYLQRAQAVEEAVLGPDNPHVASSIHNIGAVLLQMREFGRAEQQFARALAIREAALGADHPDVAITLNGLGDARAALGRIDEAVALLERSVRIGEAAGGDPLALAESRVSLANALDRAGRSARADALRREGCAVLIATGDATRQGACAKATPP